MKVPVPRPVTVPVAAEGRQVPVVGLVAGGGEVGNTLGGDRVDRLGDETGLEEGIVGEADVVDDDLGARGVGQGQDVLGDYLVSGSPVANARLAPGAMW